jgi:hypothetical protein
MVAIFQKGRNKTKLHGFSPQANYTDRATATCRRSWCQLLRIEGVAWSAQRIPTAVNLGFLDPEPVLFHSSRSSIILMTHYFSENLVAPGNRSRDLWICSQEFWPLDHRGGLKGRNNIRQCCVTIFESILF